MATYTPNLNLGKPEETDPFGNFRQLFNDNMDKLDNGGGGGSGGHTIVDENGADMPAESKLQFTGAVSVTDDNVNGATVVDILGGGGSNLILDAKIYSTEEKQVGVWTDKKPIYKKSALIQNINISANSDTTVNISDYFSNVEGVVDYECCGSSGEVIFPNMMAGSLAPYSIGVTVEQSSNHIIFTRGGGGSATISVYLTLYYTKTTDVAGSGGYEAYGFSPVIYSDVERKIGVWRDNKPLYAKTWDLGSDIWINNYSWIDMPIRVLDYAIENIIHASGVNGDGTFFGFLGANRDQTYVQILQTRNAQITLRYVTLYYTKTTDVAGSGDYNTYGVPTVHYDTSEQVIGTWINGKPLYEITVEVNSVNHNDWTDVFSLADADIKGYDSRTSYAQLNNGERVQLDWFVTTSIYNRSIITNSGTKFRVETQGNNYSKIVATIQYTKSTDT